MKQIKTKNVDDNYSMYRHKDLVYKKITKVYLLYFEYILTNLNTIKITLFSQISPHISRNFPEIMS